MKFLKLSLVLLLSIQISHQSPYGGKGLHGSSVTLTEGNYHHGGVNLVPPPPPQPQPTVVQYPVSNHNEEKTVTFNLGFTKYKPGQFIHKLIGHKLNKHHGQGVSYGVNTQVPSYGHGYKFNTQGSTHGVGNGCNVCPNDHNVNTNTGFGVGFHSQGGYTPSVNTNHHNNANGWSGAVPSYGGSTNTQGFSSTGGFNTGGSYGHNQNAGGGHVSGGYGGSNNGYDTSGFNFNAHGNANNNAGDFITNTETLSTGSGYGSNSHDVIVPQNTYGSNGANTNTYSGSGNYASSSHGNVNTRPVESGTKGAADWSSLDNVGLNLDNIMNNNAQSSASASSHSASTSIGNDLFKVTSGFSSSSASASSTSNGGGASHASAHASSSSSSGPSYG